MLHKLRRSSRACAVAVLGFAMSVVIACGGGSGDGEEVTVTLTEWVVGPSVSAVAEGDVTFVINNAGDLPHNFVVIATDLPPGELPTLNGSVEMARVNVEGAGGPFAPGTGDGKVTLELSPAKYVLFCDVVVREGSGYTSHYENGMFVAFTVN